jgi:NitT/TauT family transport system substrate-binding protein
VSVVSAAVRADRRDEVAAVVRALVKISRVFAANPDGRAQATAPCAAAPGPEDMRALAAGFEGPGAGPAG